MASLREKIMNVLRDIKWVVSVARRPDENEFKTTTRFLFFIIFVAGVFQLVFHISGLYLSSFIYKQPLASLGDPIAESIAVLVSMGIILVGMLYLLIKLR